MSNSETKAEFTPRPEAHADRWDKLLPPVRNAVGELLARIDGAVSKAAQKDDNGFEQVFANCFFVYGERETGKSTVLLSAKAALQRKDAKDFFVLQRRRARDNQHGTAGRANSRGRQPMQLRRESDLGTGQIDASVALACAS